jgi:hypothetical protein
MADALILYNNKANTYQFTVVTEGIALSEATISLCIQVAEKTSISFKCTPGLDGIYICEITNSSIVKEGIHKCWLEVVTSNGLIFKPFVTEVEVKQSKENTNTSVSASIKSSTKTEPKKEEKKEEKPVVAQEPKKEEKPEPKKDEKKDEASVSDAKLHNILQDLGLSSKRSIVEQVSDRSKIPPLKMKIKSS